MAPASDRIIYLTQPLRVSMSDWYYDLAGLDHFWVRRRFDVMKQMVGHRISQATVAGEIGCGNGVLQRLMEDQYNIPVVGFELNETCLKKNLSRISPIYCYDIHQRSEELRAHFDVLLLFDVLEHIEDESAFLDSIKYHLTDSGRLVVNVPAHQFLFSEYDRAAGHYRRYTIHSLTNAVERVGLKIHSLTYWGMPLVPLLFARKVIVKLARNEGGAYRVGFNSGKGLSNSALGLLARCEWLPQKLVGTSLMAVVGKKT